jgi:hypothetical protein
MTTIDELYAQVNALPPDQRTTLIARLLHDTTPDHASDNQLSWGQNLVRLIESMPPIQLIDDHIDDPVAWVNAQRAKRQTLVEARVAEYDAQHGVPHDNHNS